MYGKIQESGLIEIMPLIHCPAMWGQTPVLFISRFPQGSPAHRLWWLQLLMTGILAYQYGRKYMFISLKCIWYLIELLKMSEFIGWTISYKVAGQLWRVGSGGEEFLVWVREESRLHSIVIETCAGFHKRARDLRDMVFKEHESFICFQSKSEGNEMQILEANKHLVNTHTLVSVLEND